MSNAHTQAFGRRLATGTSRATAFASTLPIVSLVDSFAAQGLFIVKGSFFTGEGADQKAAQLDKRWCTLTIDEVKSMLALAEKDNAVHSIRVLSNVAGNAAGIGSEPAVVLDLSKHEKLAASLGLDYKLPVTTGNAGQYTTIVGNQIALTLEVVAYCKGINYPPIEKTTERTSRADNNNPTLQEAVIVFKTTGALPERSAQPRAPRGVDSNLASMFGVDQEMLNAQAQAGRERAEARRSLFAANNTI